MSDPDNFLSRWSRRKREATVAPEKDAGPQPEKDNETARSSARDEPANPGNSIPAPAAPPASEFDVSKLPPVESIGAETDISVFMQKGVPSALRYAALRRAWSADPAIRDFVGLNENFWDAAGPDGVPGFGDLDPGFDVKRMVAELFGEPKRESAKPDVADSSISSASDTQKSADGGRHDGAPILPEKSPAAAESPSGNAAAQKNHPRARPEKKIARRHGGAMPE